MRNISVKIILNLDNGTGYVDQRYFISRALIVIWLSETFGQLW